MSVTAAPAPADRCGHASDTGRGWLREPMLLAVIAIASVYGLLSFLLPHPYPSFDEAKYLAIGQNALAGRGPLTAFGDAFLPHAPFWPMLFAAPAVALGLDAWTWGYLLNAVAATGVLLLAARFALRFGRLAALLTVVVLADWLGLFGLARTARLDVPEGVLALLYLAVAWSAIESGLVRRGILAGTLFAWAFLTKEASLVLLAAPFFAAIATRRPADRIARVAGLVVLLVVPLVSWWFAWYAAKTGKVFALGLPSSAMLPLAVVLLALGAALLAVGWLGRHEVGDGEAGVGEAGLGGAGSRETGPGVAASGLVARARRATAAADRRLGDRRVAHLLATVLTAAWMIAFLVAFSRSEVQAGRPLLDFPNVARWIRAWASDLWPVAVAGVGGLALLPAVVRGNDRPVELLTALATGSTWVFLVAVLGEPPRNDIAELAILVAFGAGGWMLVAERLRGHDRAMLVAGAAVGASVALALDLHLASGGIATSWSKSIRGVAIAIAAGGGAGALLASVPARQRIGAWLEAAAAGRRGPGRGLRALEAMRDGRVLAVLLVAVLSLGTLGAVSARVALGKSNTSRLALANDVASWLDANLPAGSTVMFGSVQANETALVLGGRFRLRHLQATIGTYSASAPLGVLVSRQPVTDLVVMDRHPRQDGALVFTASLISRNLSLARPAAIAYVTGIDTATPSMVDWLARASGISLATTIESPPGSGTPLVARIYRVDMATLSVPSDRLYASSAAILDLLSRLGSAPQARSIAAALLDRVVLTDPGASADRAMAALHAAAGR